MLTSKSPIYYKAVLPFAVADMLSPLALLVVKGGDVEQLIDTSYVQPYVQIVSSHNLSLRTLSNTDKVDEVL